MARQTSFRFTMVPNPAIDVVCARHAGAARFAYNQDLRAVMKALDSKRADEGMKVPWTGFDMINNFNAWKRSIAAGRTWAVDSCGVVELADWWLPGFGPRSIGLHGGRHRGRHRGRPH